MWRWVGGGGGGCVVFCVVFCEGWGGVGEEGRRMGWDGDGVGVGVGRERVG